MDVHLGLRFIHPSNTYGLIIRKFRFCCLSRNEIKVKLILDDGQEYGIQERVKCVKMYQTTPKILLYISNITSFYCVY